MSDNAAVPGPHNHAERVQGLAEEMYTALLELIYARKESTDALRRVSYMHTVQTTFDHVLHEQLETERETRPPGVS